jgi:hypothetical protein
MIETKADFYVEMQKNMSKTRVILEINDVLLSLPTKICECVKSHDKDLEKYVELFETKMVELETEQKNYDKKAAELKEARYPLFSILPDNESVEVTTAKEKEKITKMMYDFITAIQGVQQGIISFRETHKTKTDMDESIQNVEDVISATFTLLTTNDMR